MAGRTDREEPGWGWMEGRLESAGGTGREAEKGTRESWSRERDRSQWIGRRREGQPAITEVILERVAGQIGLEERTGG